MSPERLRQIEELFHAVREGSAERQAALLARADPELRREVESLLGRQSENLFLDRAAVEASAQSPDDSACPTLSAGTFLGPYRVEGKLGEGGMGEVYRARDTRLKRDVAVKVLPRTFARDTDRCARFRREAELLATLNHPHIAAVYGLEEAGDLTALVLELVEGPTLADRLTEGAVPLDEALAIARQIAEALEAAHEKGIIHRDLKPANIKVRPDGTVKVLDFGLAKSLEPTGVPSILSELVDRAESCAHARRHDSGHPRVHVTRAGAWQSRGQANRHLGIRLRALRDADGQEAVSGRDRDRHRCGDYQQRA